MIARRLTSLLAMLCLLLAAAVSLAQSVAVAGTHLHHDAEQMSAILDHGHAHDSDWPDHDAADHTHDVASVARPLIVPMLTRTSSWTRHGSSLSVPDAGGGSDRPPRHPVTT